MSLVNTQEGLSKFFSQLHPKVNLIKTNSYGAFNSEILSANLSSPTATR